jgi:hypothetical protein
MVSPIAPRLALAHQRRGSRGLANDGAGLRGAACPVGTRLVPRDQRLAFEAGPHRRWSQSGLLEQPRPAAARQLPPCPAFHVRHPVSGLVADPFSHGGKNVGLGNAAEIRPLGRCPMRDHVERYGLCQPFRRCHRAGHALRRQFYCVETRASRLPPCPSARPGVARARAAGAEGDRPPLRAARRAGLHKRLTGCKASGCGEARKTGETARVGAGICRRFTLVRARGGAP